jgi:hypothetical protein
MPVSRLTAAWCRRSSATSGLALAALVALPLAAGAAGSGSRTVALRVVVRGDGAVVSGKRTCRSRCTWRVVRGTRVEARPAMGSRLARWEGACVSRRPACGVRKAGPLVARFAHITALVSWSSHTTCKPVRTTIPEILGATENASHGATEAGGRFQPHFRGPPQQHQLNPACEIGGTPTFVEVDDVYISRKPNRSADHDDSTNVTQAGRPDITNPQMKTMHIEIDGTWIDGHVAPPLWPDKLGTRVDVQGFVFWDTAHVDTDWHQHSGWELHPVAAWRYSSR